MKINIGRTDCELIRSRINKSSPNINKVAMSLYNIMKIKVVYYYHIDCMSVTYLSHV